LLFLPGQRQQLAGIHGRSDCRQMRIVARERFAADSQATAKMIAMSANRRRVDLVVKKGGSCTVQSLRLSSSRCVINEIGDIRFCTLY